MHRIFYINNLICPFRQIYQLGQFSPLKLRGLVRFRDLVQSCTAGKDIHHLPRGTLGCRECTSLLGTGGLAAIRPSCLGGCGGGWARLHTSSSQRQDQNERALWPEAGQVTAQRHGPSNPSLEPLEHPGLGSVSLDWVEWRRNCIQQASHKSVGCK